MSSFGLVVQRLPSVASRVLVLGQVAGAHLGDSWFGPSNVDDLFEALRVPPPGNTSQELARLRTRGLVRRRSTKPSWTITPEGAERCVSLVGAIDPAALETTIGLKEAGGTVFGHALHAVVPPILAPVKWAHPIAQMLKEYDFDTNVFCMTRFPRDATDSEFLDPVAAVIPVIREGLRLHGLTLHLASDRALDEDLYGNIAAHMWACRFGVALFEDRLDRGLNHNMIIEVGAMMTTGRRCALLRDRTIDPSGGTSGAESMPVDLVGQIYKSVDLDDLDGISTTVHRWVAHDLALGICPKCPSD